MARMYLHLFAILSIATFFLVAQLPAAAGHARGLLVVSNKGDETLSIIDPAAGKQVAAVPEGGTTGHEVIVSPDGKTAYVPIYGNSGVGKAGTDGSNMVAIDLATRKITGNLDFGRGVRPHCPIFNHADGMLYVTTEIDKTISVVDPHSLKIVGTVPTGQTESHMLTITRDGKWGYTANVGPGTVSVLDLKARKTVKIIPISKETQRISLSADDSMVFTSDQTKPQLAVIDTAKNELKTWVPLPSTGYGTAATHDGKWLVVALPKINKVAAVDLKTMKVVHLVDVPATPQEVLIAPGDQVAYVSCDASGKVAAIDTATWTVKQVIAAGKLADGLAWAAN